MADSSFEHDSQAKKTPLRRRNPESNQACYESLVELCPNGIAFVQNGLIVQTNPALAELTGSMNVAARSPVSTLFDPVRQDQIVRELETGLAEAGEAGFGMPVSLRRADGILIPVDLFVRRIRFSGQPGMVLVFRPQALMMAEMPLSDEAIQRWVQLNRMATFGEIAASLIHELGQSLTGVRGASDILAQCFRNEAATIDPIVRDAVDLLIMCGQRSSDQVSRIWNFVQRGQAIPVRVSCERLFSEVIAMVSAGAQHAGVRIQIDRAADLPDLRVDPSLMQLALARLLRHCITWMTSNGVPRPPVEMSACRISRELIEIRVRHLTNTVEISDRQNAGKIQPSLALSPEEATIAVCRVAAESSGGAFRIVEDPRRNLATYSFLLKCEH